MRQPSKRNARIPSRGLGIWIAYMYRPRPGLPGRDSGHVISLKIRMKHAKTVSDKHGPAKASSPPCPPRIMTRPTQRQSIGVGRERVVYGDSWAVRPSPNGFLPLPYYILTCARPLNVEGREEDRGSSFRPQSRSDKTETPEMLTGSRSIRPWASLTAVSAE